MARMSLQTAFDQARQWLETNDLDRAIGMAHHILETYPHCLEAHQMLGEAHLANRQYEEARADFERVLTFDPEHIPALVGLGMTCERLGQLDHAISAFERALEIKPDLPELRSQLLRLYTDAWGSEYAHLRLSRAGLARLYAKGYMMPQAISEFRQVVADHPDRFDSRVALAEVLWRDEQEEEAADVCRSILAKQSNVLKANLILGYIELAAGNPSGEQFWKTAAAIDPYQSMARALFESLPPVDVPEPTLPEWDETEWFNRQGARPPNNSPPPVRWKLRRQLLSLRLLRLRHQHRRSPMPIAMIFLPACWQSMLRRPLYRIRSKKPRLKSVPIHAHLRSKNWG